MKLRFVKYDNEYMEKTVDFSKRFVTLNLTSECKGRAVPCTLAPSSTSVRSVPEDNSNVRQALASVRRFP